MRLHAKQGQKSNINISKILGVVMMLHCNFVEKKKKKSQQEQQNSTFEYTASHILKMITRGAEVEVADFFCTDLQIQLIAKKTA